MNKDNREKEVMETSILGGITGEPTLLPDDRRKTDSKGEVANKMASQLDCYCVCHNPISSRPSCAHCVGTENELLVVGSNRRQ